MVVSIFHLFQYLHADLVKLSNPILRRGFVIAAELGGVARRAQVNDFIIVECHAHVVGSVDVATSATKLAENVSGFSIVCNSIT